MPTDPHGQRPLVSVIVSTANRPAPYVQRLFQRLRDQSYRPLELVLVLGPCPADMKEFADGLADVKVRHIPELNLAYSRNVGIGMASGEILAFIDDDAEPSYLWLHELVEAFEREGPSCGGVGGSTIHANAQPAPLMQNRNAIVSETGDAHNHVRLEPGDQNSPEGPWFNRLHGCNMAFRRTAIEAIGGFDANFIYQHEETDLCVRMIRAGYRIVHHPRAYVDHFPASSHFRKNGYDISYFNILRSYTYFAIKHTKTSYLYTSARVFRSLVAYWKWFVIWTLTFKIKPWDAARFLKQWLDGYSKGLRLGWRYRSGKIEQAPLQAAPTREFLNLRSMPTWQAPASTEGRGLKIALICGEFGGSSPGGIAVYTEYLAEGLARQGHEVVVLRGGYGPGNTKPSDYQVVGIPHDSDKPFSLSVLRWLRSVQDQMQFDVVEAPLWNGEGAAVGVSGFAPLVVRLETPSEVIRQISGLPLDAGMVGGIAAERLELSYASGVIAISRAIAKTIEDVYDAKLDNHARQSTVIPIGLPDADELPREPLEPLDPHCVRMLYVGRLEARKGILELGRAFAQAAQRDAGLVLWLAGSDNSDSDGHKGRAGKTYVETLKELWGPELSKRVRFLGRVSDGMKTSLIEQCDIFVAPSLYESFGIVFLEAMRLGKPVIGTKTGGIPEIVLDGDTGLLVTPGDSVELGRAITTLGGSPVLRSRMGVSGRERFLAHFTVDEFARRSELFYREVIARWQGTRFAEPAATDAPAKDSSRAA
ncbi:glycosyltransferase [Singulisphaera sp. PoT]|uniref:glycosyltransferase n=1 Tax=Singulisphaera sp. PoT TaxID=3411797 RepID=UPI003BF60924